MQDTEYMPVFEMIFGEADGYVRIFKIDRMGGGKAIEEQFFEWPSEKKELKKYIEKNAIRCDLYFCPHLFNRESGKKDHVSIVPALWADLDDCPPGDMLVRPTLVIESSPKRYQAIWKLDSYVDPFDAEKVCKRIAYFHKDAGADTSGWDLSQLLRIPGTSNHKYGTPQDVKIVDSSNLRYTLESFSEYPALNDESRSLESKDVPYGALPDKNAEEVLDDHKVRLNPLVFRTFRTIPENDWSKAMWTLLCALAESGLTVEEAFVVAREAKCNKYKRDGRPESMLWNETVKAFKYVETKDEENAVMLVSNSSELSDLLSEDERKDCAKDENIIKDYIDWAKSLGDAAPQYHQAGGFVILSSIMAGKISLPTSFGTVLPNLWFMILADTTLTRKTTAMDVAMELILELDPDAMLATDGSIEGLMTSLSMRPGRPSIFLRDEVTGLIDAMGKKDYYSGMLETFTKLYDGKFQRRILRKETIDVKDPVLIFFGGGIKSKMQELLSHHHVSSGFMPRFIIITAEVDMTRIKPIGPPTENSMEGREDLLKRFSAIREHYWSERSNNEGNRVQLGREWKAKMTPDAWARYNQFEQTMVEDALQSPMPELMTPTMDRLAKSGLKAAVLLSAASRLEDKILIDEEDIVKAFYYVEQWRTHAVHMIANVGMSHDERVIERVYAMIKNGNGTLRSDIMRSQRLTSRDADGIFATLEQRGLVARRKDGRAEFFYSSIE